MSSKIKDILGEKETHESYGMIQVSRQTSSHPHALFGSSIKHSSTISLRINTAEIGRNLHQDWYYKTGEIIEVEMSATQFAEFITSMNVGEGIPCTIRYLQRKRMEDPPFVSKRMEFQQEFKEDMQELNEQTTDGFADIKDLLLAKDRLSKEDRKHVVAFIEKMMQEIRSNIPFVAEQFNRQINKTVTEARQEVEAYVLHNIIERGLASFKEEVLSLPDMENKDSEIKQVEES
jgi:hypothetical protein